MTNLGLRMITVFGLGRLRPAPGTWGSLPPVGLSAFLLGIGAGPVAHPVIFHAILAAVVIVFSYACLAFGDHAEARFLRKDPSQVVADETVGQCLPLMLLPASSLATPGRAALTLLGAFMLFRIMDIAKPWPARQIQRVPGGLGILLDDLVAGLYAMALVQVGARLVG